MKSGKLLPFWCKTPGLILIGAGLILSGLYLWTDFQLYLNVPALVSSFLQTSWFTVIRTNIADELLMICLLSGFMLVVFSQERNERKRYHALRLRSMYNAVEWNSLVLLLSIILIYGQGFIIILVLNMISVFVFYLFFFYRSRQD